MGGHAKRRRDPHDVAARKEAAAHDWQSPSFSDCRLLPCLSPWSMVILWRRRIVGDRCARTLLSCRRSIARTLTCSTMSRYERQSILQSPGSGNDFVLSNFISRFTFKQ